MTRLIRLAFIRRTFRRTRKLRLVGSCLGWLLLVRSSAIGSLILSVEASGG